MPAAESKPWRFLSNHTQVLLCISQNPDARLRDIALNVQITERATHRILTDLVDSGYVERVRVGRRNRYLVNPAAAMRHPAQHGQEVGALLALLSVTTELGSDRPTAGGEDTAEAAHEARPPAENDQQEPNGIPT